MKINKSKTMRTVGAEGRDAGAPGPASAGRRRPVQFTSFLSKFLPKCLIFYYYYSIYFPAVKIDTERELAAVALL
jgi:hypothetical protein